MPRILKIAALLIAITTTNPTNAAQVKTDDITGGAIVFYNGGETVQQVCAEIKAYARRHDASVEDCEGNLKLRAAGGVSPITLKPKVTVQSQTKASSPSTPPAPPLVKDKKVVGAPTVLGPEAPPAKVALLPKPAKTQATPTPATPPAPPTLKIAATPKTPAESPPAPAISKPEWEGPIPTPPVSVARADSPAPSPVPAPEKKGIASPIPQVDPDRKANFLKTAGATTTQESSLSIWPVILVLGVGLIICFIRTIGRWMGRLLRGKGHSAQNTSQAIGSQEPTLSAALEQPRADAEHISEARSAEDLGKIYRKEGTLRSQKPRFNPNLYERGGWTFDTSALLGGYSIAELPVERDEIQAGGMSGVHVCTCPSCDNMIRIPYERKDGIIVALGTTHRMYMDHLRSRACTFDEGQAPSRHRRTPPQGYRQVVVET